jgi:hypothetical protein
MYNYLFSFFHFNIFKVEKIKHTKNNITQLFNNIFQKFSFYTPFMLFKTYYDENNNIKCYSNDFNRCKSNSIYSDITDNSSDINIDVEKYFNNFKNLEQMEYIEDLYNYNLDDHNIISPNSELYSCN